MAVKNIVHAKRYTQNGEEKTKWTQVGILIEKGDKQYVKLEYLPTQCEEDGSFFFSVFESGHGANAGKPERPPLSDNAQLQLDKSLDEDDIPF